jgi:hypothetical protein
MLRRMAPHFPLRWLALVLMVLSLAVRTRAQEPAAQPDPFAPLRFFVGTWRGEQHGQPGHGIAERTYQFVLDGRFLQVNNTSTYPPKKQNKAGEVHHDMGMIGYDKARKQFVFRQFHTEGFVNTYVQENRPDRERLVFTSEAIENIAPGWRARETYFILNETEFIERFELAEPGKEFTLYSEAHLKRVANP